MIRLINVASNLHKVILDDLVIWFSYETPIAFRVINKPDFYGLYITKNIWSVTTGKHLNIIDPDKSLRIENHEFIKLLEEVLQ